MATPTSVMDKDWLVFDPNPSKPRIELPLGAVDAHCHVFGPSAQFPFAQERKYTPCDAPVEQLFALRDHLGFTRNVIVQATCHGSDNSALLHALSLAGDRARGVATVRPTVTNAELDDLHARGVRGVRFNFVRRLVDPKPDSYYLPIVERVAERGWHVVLYFEPPDLEERWEFFTSLPVPIVIDHMGCPDVTKSVEGAEFARFVEFMQHPNVWAKVSCPERLSASGPPDYVDVVPFARYIVESFPDRVLWGTDWPHPNLRKYMPDDGRQVDFLASIATTAQLLHRLLVDNPNQLYWETE